MAVISNIYVIRLPDGQYSCASGATPDIGKATEYANAVEAERAMKQLGADGGKLCHFIKTSFYCEAFA